MHYTPYIKPFIPLYLYSDETTSEELNQSKTVVGIVVAPKEHFNDGKMRVVSLYDMADQSDWSNPTIHTGTTITNTTIKWAQGSYNASFEEANSIVHINADNTISETTGTGYLPSDKFNTPFTQGNITYWAKYNNSSATNKPLPSPFLEDGISKNQVYTDNSVTNAYSYIENGVSNTNAIIACTENTPITVNIPNNENVTSVTVASGTPAASACKLYCPGFHNGEWYLPTVGELGYIMINFNAINEKITAASGSAVEAYGYWSSSEYTSGNAWFLDFWGGNNYYAAKVNTYRIRSFLSI